MDRYARQIAVPEFGAAGQRRLRQARVLIIGAGGLAAPVLQYLVGAGLGAIRLVDPDRVDLSNLHRQTLFRQADLGEPKAEAAARHMRHLNPETEIEPVTLCFNSSNAETLCSGCDLVIECADSFAVSYIASDVCFATRTPLISAAVVGMEGYCGGFCGGVPGLRTLFPDAPQHLQNCSVDGVLGPCVGVIGALQAHMAVSVLTQLWSAECSNPLGQIIRFDAQRHRFSGFRFDHVQASEDGPRFISPNQIEGGDFVVDLREVGESGPSLAYASRHNVHEFGPDGLHPKAGQRTVLACNSGLRAWQAADRLSRSWRGEIVLIALGSYAI